MRERGSSRKISSATDGDVVRNNEFRSGSADALFAITLGAFQHDYGTWRDFVIDQFERPFLAGLWFVSCYMH